LPSSKATGAQQIGRLTNLMQLTVDTSWYTRYRSSVKNPDLDPGFKFPQAVPSLAAGQFPAIPMSDADLTPDHHIQAIANTAAFHFCFIEQGGSSLYPILALKVTNLEVLRVLLSIGPTETSHFQTWHDKAGNAISDPLAPLTDPKNPQLVFPNLNVAPFGGEDFQTNLIMPEPCPFLSRKFRLFRSSARPRTKREARWRLSTPSPRTGSSSVSPMSSLNCWPIWRATRITPNAAIEGQRSPRGEHLLRYDNVASAEIRASPRAQLAPSVLL
jgi:hypothetical protein